jgi:Prolipoprotein diacylglyceryl transferase
VTVRGRNVRVLLREAFNGNLDQVVRPRIHIYHLSWSAYQVCGYTGLMLAIVLAITLVTYRELSPWVMAGLAVSAMLTFLGLVMATKIVTGEETIIYYHHEIAVMIVAALVLWLLRLPIVPYLDVTILGVGCFLTCGRVGCLMVGCCHGRPHGWGICYRQEHADAGFTPYFVDVRLFPIQAVESLCVFVIVLVGSGFVLSGYPVGTTLAWYSVAYGMGRFWFEFMRGDPERPYYWGFSQAQWISLLLMCGVVSAELSGVLPFYLWHTVATAFIVLLIISISVRRHYQNTPNYQLGHPRHIKEVAEALQMVSHYAAESTANKTLEPIPHIHVARTSLGIRISGSPISGEAGSIRHFALSSQNGMMTEEAAGIVADLIHKLKYPSESLKLIRGNRGVFHLLIQPAKLQ